MKHLKQKKKVEEVEELKVGTQKSDMVAFWFCSPSEEYFYATITAI
jgi:hypothetical protein